MKILVGVDLGGYTFNAAAKTVTLTGLSAVDLEQVLLISNVTSNEIIYQFNKVGYGATVLANVLTLDFDTTSMSNGDNLQIFIEYQNTLATEVTQLLVETNTSNLDVALSTRLKPSDTLTKVTTVDTITNPVTVNVGLTDTQLRATAVDVNITGGSVTIGAEVEIKNDTGNPVPISDAGGSLTIDASSLPLPTGASTSANQSTIIGHLDGVEGLLGTVAGAVAGTEMQVDVLTMPTVTIQDGGGSITVDGTVAVTGAGDASAANQATEITALGTLNTSVNTLLKPANTLAAVTSITNVVHVDDNAGSLTVDGSVTANAGTNLNTSALALETGGNLASIKAKTDNIPALGQALAAASTPVVLTAAQITTLTPVAAITGFATSAKQDILLTELQLKADLTETQPVSLATIPLATGASTSALQTTGNTSLSTLAGAVSGSEVQVDVLTMPTTTVQATNLDIRDLAFATDKVDISGSTLDVTITEFPAAAVSSDNFTNPTTTNVMAMGMVFDGVTWDRSKGDSTDGTLVNLGSNNDVTVTGSVTANAGANLNTSLLSTSAKQDTLLAELQLKADLTETQPVSLTSTTITGTVAVTQSGTWDEVGINDSGNSITVDAPVGTPAFVRLSDGVAAITTLPVSLATNTPTLQSGSTTAVTQATGTNLHTVVDSGVITSVTSITNALPTGNNVIGQVKLTDGTDIADILDLTNSNPLTVAIVDGSGTQITSFGGGTQYTQGDTDATITGTAMLMEGAADTLLPVQGTVADGLLVNLGANNDVTVTGTVAVSATDLDIRNLVFATDKVDITGSTLAANSGVDIGDVTINNASGASAVNIQDGGNSITVDGTVTANISGSISNTSFTATQATGTNLHTVVDSGVITTVSAVTAITNALPAGTNNIGDVDVLSCALPTLASTSTKQSDGSQKTQIVDGTGAVIDAISGGGYDNLLIAMGATNYVLSTVNSTAAQLTAGSTFTGTIETVFNQQSYSILLVSDQNGTLTLKQYIDSGGTQLISSIAISTSANTPFARSGVLNGNFFNLTYQNNGASTTTTLKIDTAYGTIPSATQLNNAPVSINEINGVASQSGSGTSTGALRVELPTNGTGTIGINAGTNNIGDVDVLTLPAITIAAAQTLATVTTVGAVTSITNALPAGTNAIGKLAANSGIDIGDVDITSIIPGTGATNLGKAEDGTHTTGDVGIMALGVTNESGTALSAANTRYTPIAVDKMGQIYVNPESNKVLFRGISGAFRTLGRAGTAGQKILAIHNATASSITVQVNRIIVDMFCTVAKVITVAPPIVRIWKFTAVPTNGTALTKNKIGGTTTSNASCTVWNDSSSDGTGSGTTLTVTLPAGTILDQKVVPRVITAAGEISISSMEFNYPNGIQLAALEGICVFLDYTLATQNPTTDMWVASIEFEEFTT